MMAQFKGRANQLWSCGAGDGFFATAVGKLKRSKETNGIPSKAYTNSAAAQNSMYCGGQHILASYTICVMSEGQLLVCARGAIDSTRVNGGNSQSSG